jgi:pyridinium-3,5-biscarboxylic acid mononucleotide synthase
MNQTRLKKLLRQFQSGTIPLADILNVLQRVDIEDIHIARIDHGRTERQGFPEVILCEGKTPAQIAAIASRIVRRGSLLLATRANRRDFVAVKRKVRAARFNPVARTITANEELVVDNGGGTILVMSAGTSDLPVAEEAIETARIMGNRVDRLHDVGVAGIHRVLSETDRLRSASVIIVVAGMEGALPSVVGGLVSVPVIAVPTSVGYGASFGGVSALLGMLNSCAPGVTVVNIDNGFGAGFAASRINRIGDPARTGSVGRRSPGKRKTNV